jgi:two-component system phosphate regulon response regulator PhoB
MNICILEDETDIRELIEFQLLKDGHRVHTAGSIKSFQEHIHNKKDYHLFIIDRMLPDGNGVDLCKELRASQYFKNTSIIFVTALTQPENIVEGLEAGADDYITKPFDISVLNARIKNQLKRIQLKNNSNKIEVKNLLVEIDQCLVEVDNEKVNLTATEFKILSFLISYPGIVHSRDKLIKEIIGDNIHVTSRTIDTHMAGLRKKLGTAADLIETIRGIGYRFILE